MTRVRDVRLQYGDLDLTDYPYSLEFGYDLGSPQAVYAELASMLADGSIVSSPSSENREVQISILVEGPDLLSIAEACLPLEVEALRQRNRLTLDPGDGIGAPIVVDTFRAQVDKDPDPRLMEAGLRRYVLTIPAAPFVRSTQPTVTEFDAVPAPSTTLVNDATSLSGWSGQAQDSLGAWSPRTPLLGADSVSVTNSGFGPQGVRLELTQTFAVPADRRYLRAPLAWSSAGRELRATIGGVDQVVPLVGTGPGDGSMGYSVWLLPVGTVTRLLWESRSGGGEGIGFVQVGRTELASTPAFPTTTRRQRLMTAEVGGSARAPVSLRVTRPSGSGPLGSVMLYADPTSARTYTPDTRRFRTSTSGRTANGTTISGYYEPLTWTDSPYSYLCELPASMYDGTYTLIARVGRVVSGTIDEVLLNVTRDGVSSDYITKTLPMPGGTSSEPSWRWVVIGSLDLPPRKAAPYSPESFTLSVSARDVNTDTDPAVVIDDLFLCHHDADLTLLEMQAEQALWINEPSPAEPFGSIWVSPDGDLANAYAPSALVAQGRMRVQPPTTSLFVAASGVDDAKVTATFYEHYLH